MRIFLLFIIFINIRKNIGLNTTACLSVAQNPCHEPVFKTDEFTCEGWICWESQLTLENKVYISKTINDFRNLQAANVSNMNKLLWHWALELEAIKAAATCTRKNLEIYHEARNIEGLGYSLKCENGCIHKENMLLPSQNQFKNLLFSFLKENNLQDFDENMFFRRGSALYFGCALVIIRTVINNIFQNIFEFVCVFCTTEPSIYSVYKNVSFPAKCPSYTVYGADFMFPQLCAVPNMIDLYVCELDNYCSPEEKPELWKRPFVATVAQLKLLETNVGPILLINETQTRVQQMEADGTLTSQTNFNLYIDKEGKYTTILQHYPPVPKSVYYFSEKQTKILNETVHSLFDNNIHYQFPIMHGGCTVIIPSMAKEGSEDAWCCFYLLIGTTITTVLLIVLIYYTIQDYRKKTI